MAVPRKPLAEVIGANCERIRTASGLTQDEFARYARALGLRWKASSVGDFEAGRSAPKLSTVLTVAIALHWAITDAGERFAENPALPKGVTLADLMGFDGIILLNDSFRVSGRFLVEACRGYTLELGEHQVGAQAKSQTAIVDAVTDLMNRGGLTERRQARRMGIEPAMLAALSLKLWQRTFSAERDRRAGPDANRQKRGQVTRAMQAELDDMRRRFDTRGGELAHLASMEVWSDGES